MCLCIDVDMSYNTKKTKEMNNTGEGRGLGRGPGRGRNKGGSFGTGGYCVCAKCGAKIHHQQGEKCTNLKCPECGKTMIREELLKK